MSASLTDIILIVIIAFFGFSGFWFGFIHMLGSFLGILAASVIAGKYFEVIALKLSFLFGGFDSLGKIVTFIIIFILVTRLVGLLFFVINKIFKIVSIIPFLKTINRLVGAVLGIAEGLVLTSLTLYLLVRFPLGNTINMALSNSRVVAYLLALAKNFAPLLPEIVQRATSFIS